MTNILVVDDEPDLEELVRQRFRKKIKEEEYHFHFAMNGVKALEILDKTPEIDLVLTDINMPEMDGLKLLTRIKEQDYFLATIIVSAYGDMDNIRTAMNLGAFDFITKPIDFQDLERTMMKTIEHVLALKKSAEALRENDTLKIYLDEINAQKKLKDRFFAIISHDLRGPVGSFQGLSHMISSFIKRQEYERLNDMVEEVEKTTNQLSMLLDNLLNWASQELSIIPYKAEEININDVIADLFEMFNATALSKSIKLSNEVNPDSRVWCDRNSISTVFRNLLNNALKFTKEDGSIKVTSQKGDEYLVVEVTDDGIGMTREKVDSLFQLSDQSSTYGTHGEKGVGIGLQLVNEFTKMNKGTLEVFSKENEGTTFKIKLPTSASASE